MRAILLAAITVLSSLVSGNVCGSTVTRIDALNLHHNGSLLESRGPDVCVTFSVGAGTGCGWMCSYCASQLGTNNYYFTDGVCKYNTGEGCVGNPQANKQYTCCTA